MANFLPFALRYGPKAWGMSDRGIKVGALGFGLGVGNILIGENVGHLSLGDTDFRFGKYRSQIFFNESADAAEKEQEAAEAKEKRLEKQRAYNNKYYLKNKQRLNLIHMAWARRNWRSVLDQRRKRYAENPDVRARQIMWNRKSREKAKQRLSNTKEEKQ